MFDGKNLDNWSPIGTANWKLEDGVLVADNGNGAIVDVAAVDPMAKAGGRCNVYEITAKDNTFAVILNGQKTVDGATADKFASGRIALQHGKGVTDESGVGKFRKVEIKPL